MASEKRKPRMNSAGDFADQWGFPMSREEATRLAKESQYDFRHQAKKVLLWAVAAIVAVGIIVLWAVVNPNSEQEQTPRRYYSSQVQSDANSTGRSYSAQCRHEQRIADELLGDGKHGYWDEVSARRKCD